MNITCTDEFSIYIRFDILYVKKLVIIKGKEIHDECLLYFLGYLTTKNSNILAFGPAVKRTLDFWFDFDVCF